LHRRWPPSENNHSRPSGDLSAFDRPYRLRIGLADRFGPGRDSARDDGTLKSAPCREILVRALHGFASSSA
jgi:hypothetical protein